MAQFGRPDSDVTQTNFSGGYGTIDESSASDADYITGSSSANGTGEYGLSNVNDPTSSTGHIVRFRAWQQDKSNQRTIVASLYQGATLISTYGAAFNLVKGTATGYDWTLSADEANAISDYTDLRVRFVSGGNVGTPAASRAEVYVSWAELEVPNVPSATYTLTASAGAFTLTGVAANVLASRLLPAGAGTFTLSGVAAGLSKVYLLAAEVGTFVLTGINATLKASRLLTAAVGSFVLTGKASGLLTSRLLTTAAGSFALTGIDVTLTYIEGTPVVKTKKHNKHVEQWWGQKCCNNYLARHRH